MKLADITANLSTQLATDMQSVEGILEAFKADAEDGLKTHRITQGKVQRYGLHIYRLVAVNEAGNGRPLVVVKGKAARKNSPAKPDILLTRDTVAEYFNGNMGKADATAFSKGIAATVLGIGNKIEALEEKRKAADAKGQSGLEADLAAAIQRESDSVAELGRTLLRGMELAGAAFYLEAVQGESLHITANGSLAYMDNSGSKGPLLTPLTVKRVANARADAKKAAGNGPKTTPNAVKAGQGADNAGASADALNKPAGSAPVSISRAQQPRALQSVAQSLKDRDYTAQPLDAVDREALMAALIQIRKALGADAFAEAVKVIDKPASKGKAEPKAA